MNDEPIKKDASMSWGEAQQVINQLTPNVTSDDFANALERIRALNLAITDYNRDDYDDGPNRSFFRCVFFKTILILFYIGHSIWSATRINRQDNKSIPAFVFFIIFLCLQSIGNIIYLAKHWKDCLSQPHKINENLTLVKPLIAFFLEMPMLVSQASVMKSISKGQQSFTWDNVSWDVALQFHLVINLLLFVIIDMPYHKATKGKRWIAAAFCFSLFASVLAFAPIHLAQLGLTWRPDLNDFGGDITNTNTRILLSFSMYAGTVGLWTWPVIFPIFIFLSIWFKRKVFKFKALLKLFLVNFNILNGIWSITHLYQLKVNENREVAMIVFV